MSPETGTAIPEVITAIAVAIHRSQCPLRDDPDHDCVRAARWPGCEHTARAVFEAAAPLIRAAERERVVEVARELGATYPVTIDPVPGSVGARHAQFPFADYLEDVPAERPKEDGDHG